MDMIKQLTDKIFLEYQEDPVPIDQWLKKNGHILMVPDRGVLMYHDRELPSRRLYELEKKSTHIWLCGVVSDYRRAGVAKVLLRSMLSGKCQDTISAHINRKKFPEMTSCLEHLGFKSAGVVICDRGTIKSLERFEIATSELRDRLRF